MRRVAEDDHRSIREVQPHHGRADSHSIHCRGHFRNDDGVAAGILAGVAFRFLRGQNVLGRFKRIGFLDPGPMIAQPPLMAPQPFRDMFLRQVEGGMRVARLALAAHPDIVPDMDRDIAMKQSASAAAENNRGFKRLIKIFRNGLIEFGADTALQGIAEFDLFSRYGDLHKKFPYGNCSAAALRTHLVG